MPQPVIVNPLGTHHHIGTEGGWNPWLGRLRMESGVRTPVEEEEAGGPEGSWTAGGRLGWSLLLVVRGPLLVVVRHTVVVVQVRVVVVRLWLCVAATVVAIRRVLVLAVWLFGPGRQAGGCRRVRWGGLKADAAWEEEANAVVHSHRLIHAVQILFIHLWGTKT